MKLAGEEMLERGEIRLTVGVEVDRLRLRADPDLEFTALLPNTENWRVERSENEVVSVRAVSKVLRWMVVMRRSVKRMAENS